MENEEFCYEMKVTKDANSLFKKCYICNRESINLTECDYCGKLFCNEHIKVKTSNDVINKLKEGHICEKYKPSNTTPSNNPIMNYCLICGNALTNEDIFCNKCGTKKK